MYPYEGHPPVDRAFYPSTRAALLEKAVPYLGAVISSGIAGGGIILSQMALRGSDVAWITPAKAGSKRARTDDYVPTMPPTLYPRVEGRQVKYRVNDGNLVPGQFTTIIGNPDQVAPGGNVVFPALKGWKYDRKRFNFEKKLYSPVVFKVGDCFSAPDIGLTPPTWVLAGAGLSTNTTTVPGRFYLSDFNDTVARYVGSDVVQTAPPAVDKSEAFSPLKITGANINEYCDFCFPMLPLYQYGNVETGVGTTTYPGQKPIGLVDVFRSQLSNDGTVRNATTNLYQYGHSPWDLTATAADSLYTVGANTSSVSSAPSQAYVKAKFEVKLCNPDGASQTYEIYQCAPRFVTDHSPLFDTLVAHNNTMETNISVETDSASWQHIGRSPLQYRAVRNQWKFKKRTVTLPPMTTVKIQFSVKMSKVKYDLLNKLGTANIGTSIPGLTQWCWIRARGVQGLDSLKGLYGTAVGQFIISLHQEVYMMFSLPHICKKVDLCGMSKIDVASFIEECAVADGDADANPEDVGR